MNPAAVNNSAASLYVDNLHPEVTEAVLFEKFCKVGAILTIRVCRDAVTRRSLGYGYVNYHQAADAERALDTLDLDTIKGKPMHIAFQKDPSSRRTGLGKIFVKNLDKAIDDKAMHESFSAFGNILACKVATDENGESCGYGFVRFETEEAAQKAIQKVNKMLLNGRQVTVDKYVPRSQRASNAGGDQPTNFTNVYIKNFAVEWSEEDLYRVCQPYGKISSLRIMTDTEGNSKGFGFVSFETHEAAKECVDSLNGREYNGRQIFAGRAQTKSERSTGAGIPARPLQESSGRPQGVNLYIKNLDDDVDDERLRKEFSRFGTITSVKVMRHESGISRGFGFVCFTTQEAASNAVLQMNNQVISIKPLYVALHQSKEVRQAQLASQRMNMGYHVPEAVSNAVLQMNNQVISIKPPCVSLDRGKEVRQAQLASQRMNMGYHVPGPPMGQVYPGAFFYQNQSNLPTHRSMPPRASIPSQVTIQGSIPTPQTTPHQSSYHQPHTGPPKVQDTHPTAQSTLHGTYPGQRGLPPQGTMMTQGNLPHHGGGMYPIQYAPQVHHPRWPTAQVQHRPPTQVHHTPASQAGGYQVIAGPAGMHQYGAMNHMVAAAMPRVPQGPMPGHVTDESHMGQLR